MGKALKRKGDKNMKKMKKLFAVLLTLAMVLGMSMTSFAAKAGATLEVKGLATYASPGSQSKQLLYWQPHQTAQQ